MMRPTLIETDRGLALDAGDGRPVRIDLARLDTTSGPGRRLTTPLLKAVGIRKGDPYRPRVLDATAGYGEDAWLLAAAGCRVTAVERQPAMAALLRDALARAAAVRPDVAGRIEVVEGDSGAWLRRAADAKPQAAVAVVYLDPMFPDPHKRKTAERKPMKVLRALAGADDDADALLTTALAAATRRVVVKRPSKAPPLAGRLPTVSHPGKSLRFDVYAAHAAR